jgi:hypothetical protein
VSGWNILDAMDFRYLRWLVATFALLFCAAQECAGQNKQEALSYGQFPAEVYQGRLIRPQWLKRWPDGELHDDSDKPAMPARVNFAGEYYLTAHSCGTCCRYYTLNNLRTGSELTAAGMFDAAEPEPHTRDGHTYVAVLYFRPNSRLVVVQYYLDQCASGEEKNLCRQRYFVFENGRFKPVSKTFGTCSREGDEPE